MQKQDVSRKADMLKDIVGLCINLNQTEHNLDICPWPPAPFISWHFYN